jgi:hypothetical protein
MRKHGAENAHLEVIALSENEKDYSDYLQIGANTINILVLLSGFTFTGITILLSQFPILDSLTAQFVLFFLASLFFLFMLMLGMANTMFMRACRNLPPVTRDVVRFNRLTWVSWTLLQLAVVLMFLIWNLIYLSLATGIMLAMFIIVNISTMLKWSNRLSTKGEGKT